MQTIQQLEALRAQIADWRRAGETIAFVPTMGNLHAGHLALIGAARGRAARVVASIFVNPLQFGAGEDFGAYPRTFAQDQTALGESGCDLLFAPAVETMYPDGQEGHTRVEVPGLSDILCGASRPGHFVGVATVVCKLFNMVQPDLALFGEKDFQQLLVIRRMTADLALPVSVLGMPTVREADGLAMSSRNGYLTADERRRAPGLYRALHSAAAALESARDVAAAEAAGLAAVESAGLRPDYLRIRRARDLAPAGANADDPAAGDLIILAAAYLGRARLIDNLRIRPSAAGSPA